LPFSASAVGAGFLIRAGYFGLFAKIKVGLAARPPPTRHRATFIAKISGSGTQAHYDH
jgi:hypothetical protein